MIITKTQQFGDNCLEFRPISIFKPLLEQFKVRAKLRGRYRNVLYVPCPQTRTTSPSIDVPHQSGELAVTDETVVYVCV